MSDLRSSQELLDILKKHLNVSREADLAKKLKISAGTLGQWRHKNRIKYENVIELAVEEGLDLNSLLNPRRDIYRQNGMTAKNERYVSATGTGEVFRLEDDKAFCEALPPYDIEKSIWVQTPNYIPHPWDRYWVVPDNCMAPLYKKGDVLIIQRQSELPRNGTNGVFGVVSRVSERNDNTYVFIGKIFKGFKTIDGAKVITYRLAAINMEFEDIYLTERLDYFKIIMNVSNHESLES